MPEQSFLDRAAEVAHARLEQLGGDPAKLDIALQTVAVPYTVQGIIDNGGFRYLFENDFSQNPPYCLFADPYRRIGAFDAANDLERAVALFPFPQPYLDQEERNTFMGSLDEKHELFTLGDAVCGDESIWSNLETYAKQNVASFS